MGMIQGATATTSRRALPRWPRWALRRAPPRLGSITQRRRAEHAEQFDRRQPEHIALAGLLAWAASRRTRSTTGS